MAGSFANISGHGMVLDTTVLDRITDECRPKAHNIVERYGWADSGLATYNVYKMVLGIE